MGLARRYRNPGSLPGFGQRALDIKLTPGALSLRSPLPAIHLAPSRENVAAFAPETAANPESWQAQLNHLGHVVGILDHKEVNFPKPAKR